MTNRSCVGSSPSIPRSPGTQERALQERAPQLGSSEPFRLYFDSVGTSHYVLLNVMLARRVVGRSPPAGLPQSDARRIRHLPYWLEITVHGSGVCAAYFFEDRLGRRR